MQGKKERQLGKNEHLAHSAAGSEGKMKQEQTVVSQAAACTHHWPYCSRSRPTDV